MPGIRVDGNDVLACEAVTRVAADRARAGGGPTFVEAYTYRLAAHTTSDDSARYRDGDEEARWAALDPLLRVRRHLEAEAAADERWVAAVAEEAEDLAADIRRRCRAIPLWESEAMFDHVYGDVHDPLDAERRAFRDYRDGVVDPHLAALIGVRG
jgi:pyruvate dehydrogenase E1 component alpha subunit